MKKRTAIAALLLTAIFQSILLNNKVNAQILTKSCELKTHVKFSSKTFFQDLANRNWKLDIDFQNKSLVRTRLINNKKYQANFLILTNHPTKLVAISTERSFIGDDDVPDISTLTLDLNTGLLTFANQLGMPEGSSFTLYYGTCL